MRLAIGGKRLEWIWRNAVGNAEEVNNKEVVQCIDMLCYLLFSVQKLVMLNRYKESCLRVFQHAVQAAQLKHQPVDSRHCLLVHRHPVSDIL